MCPVAFEDVMRGDSPWRMHMTWEFRFDLEAEYNYRLEEGDVQWNDPRTHIIDLTPAGTRRVLAILSEASEDMGSELRLFDASTEEWPYLLSVLIQRS